jgi:hypothetical protein
MRPSPLAAILIVQLTLSPALAAQQAKRASAKPATQRPAVDKPASLPVTRVSLYKNGVGFFEHTGHVTGDADVSIDFTTSQLNDVLQSLTAIDLNGGRISGAGYNSTTPLDQQLKSLPLALGEDTTAADFYAAIRGARVEVHSGTASITGRLLSVEDRNTPAKDDDDSKTSQTIARHFLTVVSDSGEVRTVELTPATSVRLLDTDLHQDVTRYLQLLAGNRSQGLRHLTLNDRGTGSRELRVSYISEVPIWKSTYRILFTDNANTATLQGWAVVDNTVGEDWNNVQLSLIAGAPQSFIQPLSDPIYSRRPEIPIAQEAQLTPQTFDSSMDTEANTLASTATVEVASDRARNSQLQLQSKMIANQAYAARATGVAHGNGMGAGIGGASYGLAPSTAAMAPPPISYEEAANASITAKTQTAAFDDFFEYKLTEPITIRKNESALVPILQSKVDADRVTLVSSNGFNTSQPLRALWMTNTTGLTLDRGSFALVENGSFGGEGLMDPIHPNEKRLLSYAADQAVHVTTEGAKTFTQKVDHVTASKGVIILHRAEIREVTYVVHNSAADKRTIVLEHPVDPRFTLTSDPKPTETTATVYRFRLEAAPGETVKLHVAAKHRGVVEYQLTHSDENQIALILHESGDDAQVQAALAPILAARRHVAEAQTSVDQENAKLNTLHSDEDRQRANITALASADKSSRDRFVHDLNQTEDAISTAQAELNKRTAALDAAKADLATRIENLQLDAKFDN